MLTPRLVFTCYIGMNVLQNVLAPLYWIVVGVTYWWRVVRSWMVFMRLGGYPCTCHEFLFQHVLGGVGDLYVWFVGPWWSGQRTFYNAVLMKISTSELCVLLILMLPAPSLFVPWLSQVQSWETGALQMGELLHYSKEFLGLRSNRGNYQFLEHDKASGAACLIRQL